MEDLKVLLVDDEEDFLESLSERLRLRDVDPGLAKDGHEALRKLEQDPPTVIVLDLKMPGLDGLEVLRRLKRTHPHVQVVILSGHGTESDRREAERLGAFAYLQKPVSMDVLMTTLKKAYRRFRSVKDGLDSALMASALAQAGELDAARELMRGEPADDEGENEAERSES